MWPKKRTFFPHVCLQHHETREACEKTLDHQDREQERNFLILQNNYLSHPPIPKCLKCLNDVFRNLGANEVVM